MSRVANQLEPDSSPGSGPRHTLGFAANRKGQKRKKRDQDRGKRDAMSAKRHKAMEEAASSPASSTASSAPGAMAPRALCLVVKGLKVGRPHPSAAVVTAAAQVW